MRIEPSVLYVDLDGTFTKSDLFLESLFLATKDDPLVLFWCCIWLLKGKAYLKAELALRVNVQTHLLPLNTNFYSFLIEQKLKHRKIVLATASHEKHAESVCNDYDIFDSYISSDVNKNLKGKCKLLQIQSESPRFSYAGNSEEDFIIFTQSQESYLVNPTSRAKKLALQSTITKTFDSATVSWAAWARQLRVHQWIKNTLIFIPFMVSGQLLNVQWILLFILGFISFSCLASATYILNDLFDLESDRKHQTKKHRPLAAGRISLINGVFTASILCIIAFGIAPLINSLFLTVLVFYLTLTLAYTLRIKQYVALDVLVLAALYTLRIIAGTAILGVTISYWLLTFSMFVFLGLAILKRCAELKTISNTEHFHITGRGYHVKDYPILLIIGAFSSFLSVLVFYWSTYANRLINQDVDIEQTMLWVATPALAFWFIRMWIKTHRGDMHCDPIIFSLKDKKGILCTGILIALTLLILLV